MTDSPYLESKCFQVPSIQATSQVSQDMWLGRGNSAFVEKKLDAADDCISKVAEKAFKSEDKTPGFSRMDGHEGPGLLSPASLRDNLLQSAKELFSPEQREKYDHEGYKPWLGLNDRNSDMSMHAALHKLEKQMEQEVVKKAFGDLSITDQGLLSSSSEDTKDVSAACIAAQDHLLKAITYEAHSEIKRGSV
jgi:hypothetical protein